MPRRSRWPAHILLLATVAALLGGPAAVRPAALAADPSASDPFAPGRSAAAPAPAAAPAAFRISGGGYGHGVGMGQYGAYGMALRGRSAAAILGYYYGGAAPRRVALPAAIRVGVRQC